MNMFLLLIKNSKQLLLINTAAVIIFFCNNAYGQYEPNTELGITAGAAYYLGDLNNSHFTNTTAGGGIIIRKNIDRRVVYKAEALISTIEADDRTNNSDSISLARGLHFRSTIYELSGQIEFNFLPYETGNPLYPWTPFVFTGISLFHFNPQAENKNGEWVNLQELGTEGQGTPSFPERKKYPLTQFSIPLGGGIKIAVNESFNIMFEYGIRKTFTDYLDDVSTTYPGANVLRPEYGNLSVEMSDPNGSHAPGSQRGNSEDKDWYTFTGITLSFKIKNQLPGCDY